MNIEHIDGDIEEESSTQMNPNAPSFADEINIANNSIANADFNAISNNLDQAQTNSACNGSLLRLDATFFGSEREIGLIQYIGDYIQDETNLRNQITKQLDDNHRKCQTIQQQIDANNTKLLTSENLNNDLSLEFQTIQFKKTQLEANLSAITEQNDSMKADITAKNDLILHLTDQKGQLNAELLQTDDRDLKFQGLIVQKYKLFRTMKEEKTKIHADLSTTTKQNNLLKADVTAKDSLIVALTAEKGKLEASLLDTEQRELKLKGKIADKDNVIRAMPGKQNKCEGELLIAKEQGEKFWRELEA